MFYYAGQLTEPDRWVSTVNMKLTANTDNIIKTQHAVAQCYPKRLNQLIEIKLNVV